MVTSQIFEFQMENINLISVTAENYERINKKLTKDTVNAMLS